MSKIELNETLSDRISQLCPYRREANVQAWVERLVVRTMCLGVSLQIGTSHQHDIPTAAIRCFSELLDMLVGFLAPEDSDHALAAQNREEVRTRLRTGLVFWIQHRLGNDFTEQSVGRYIDILFAAEDEELPLDAVRDAAERTLVRRSVPRSGSPMFQPATAPAATPQSLYIPPQQTIPQGTGVMDAVARQRRDRDRERHEASVQSARERVELGRILTVFDELRTHGMMLVHGQIGRVPIPPRAVLYDEQNGRVSLTVVRKDGMTQQFHITYSPTPGRFVIRVTTDVQGWGRASDDTVECRDFREFTSKLAELLVPLEHVDDPQVPPALPGVPGPAPAAATPHQIETRERIISIGDRI
jgi:hypothetical protein